MAKLRRFPGILGNLVVTYFDSWSPEKPGFGADWLWYFAMENQTWSCEYDLLSRTITPSCFNQPVLKYYTHLIHILDKGLPYANTSWAEIDSIKFNFEMCEVEGKAAVIATATITMKQGKQVKSRDFVYYAHALPSPSL